MIIYDKVLAKYYEKWYRDCCFSVTYCLEQLKNPVKAADYRRKATEYFDIINENWDAIDNAYYAQKLVKEEK